MDGKKFYQRNWFIILMLFLFAPVGIILMWQNTSWNKIVKIALSVFFGLIFVAALFGALSDESTDQTDTSNIKQEQQIEEEEPLENESESSEKESKTEEDTDDAAEEPVKKSPYDKLSTEGKNAYRAAKNYLDFMAFSKKGLIQQLSSEYGDSYPEKVAEKAVNALEKEENIDWTEEAKEAAQNYLDTMSFSKDGLVQQLESEYGDQFTHEQAVEAVEAVYK